MQWVTNGVTDGGSIALERVRSIASKDTELARTVAGLPWFSNDITEYEARTLGALNHIADTDADLANMVANIPWFSDDITEAELWAISNLGNIVAMDAELATTVANLPWFSDDNTEYEAWTLGALNHIADTDADLANMVANIPWFSDDITEDERWAIGAMSDIATKDAELANMVANLPWFSDDITKDEGWALGAMSDIATKDAELAKTTANLPWFSDSITEDEGWAIGNLGNIVATDAELAKTTANLPWFSDSITEDEQRALIAFDHIASTDTELAKMLAATTWFTDGITEDERWALDALNNIAAKDVELAKMTASLPRFADGITEEELRALSTLGSIIHADVELANMVTNLPWFTDGVTEEELRIINTLRRIAEIDTELASQLAASVNNQSRDLDSNTLVALSHIASRSDGALGRLTSQSWFADGLNDEESALVVVLGGALGQSSKMYDDLLRSHFIQTKTVSLPLAGDVNIHVIQNAPFHSYEDLARPIGEIAFTLEQFVGAPFPTNNIILHVIVDSGYGVRGAHLRNYMQLVRTRNTVWFLAHETAHYYFHSNFGPAWIVEGMANFSDEYVNDRIGVPGDSIRRAAAATTVRSTCRYNDEPVENLRHYNYILERVYEGKWYALNREDEFWLCAYAMGENLITAVYDAIGEGAMSAAVRELYLQSRDSGRPATEEDIYRAFLKHTPYDKVEAFLDVYQRLHGGAFAFDDVDFDDDHGDEAGLATEIAVGETAEGTLDYLFDFDYFTFPAEGGQRYRVNVDHESLRTSSVTMYSRDGTTRLSRRADTPESSTEVKSGVRVLWTARRDGTYFVAVQNFGGKTGSYTLTITAVNDDEDD